MTTTFGATREASGRPPLADQVKAGLARLRQGELGMLPVLLALAVIWTFFSMRFPIFLSARNLSFLLLQISVVGIIAVGVVLVLLIGEIDLSCAVTAGVCAAVLGVLMSRYGWSAFPALVAALVAGVLIGAFQGFFVAVVRLPSFVVTLAGLLGFQGLMLQVLGRQGTVNVNDDFILSIATSYVPDVWGWSGAVGVVAAYGLTAFRRRHRRQSAGLPVQPVTNEVAKLAGASLIAAVVVWRLNQHLGVPVAGLLLLASVVGWSLILGRTAYGRHIYAVGGNPEAARRAGIDVVRVRVSVMILASLMFAAGGIVGASRFASVSYNAFAGGPMLLEAVGAAVIGGTSLFGGRGRVSSALLGALVIGSLSNGLDLYNASSAVKFMVSGAILLAAVSADALSRRRREQTGAA